MMLSRILLGTLLCVMFACPAVAVVDIIIIPDDMGRDKLGVYGKNQDSAVTPSMDTLAAQGVAFTRATATSNCSPFRVAFWTGREAHRTGVHWIASNAQVPPWVMQPSWADFVHRMPSGVRTGMSGKLHLGRVIPLQPGEPWASWPQAMGMDRGEFTTENGITQGEPTLTPDPGGNYTNQRWVGCDIQGACALIEDPTPSSPAKEFYAGHVQASAIIGMGQEAITDGVDAVFVWMTNQPHQPWIPTAPEEIAPTFYDDCDSFDRNEDCYHSHLEALDYEVARIAAAFDLDPVTGNARIWVYGDNGTPANVPANGDCDTTKSKTSIYTCGWSVPLFVVGRGVTDPGFSDQIVMPSDMGPTMWALHGGSGQTPSGRSFAACLTDRTTGCGVRTVGSNVRGEPTAQVIPAAGWSAEYHEETAHAVIGGVWYSLVLKYTNGPDPWDRDTARANCADVALTNCAAELFNLDTNYYNSTANLGVDYWTDPATMPAAQREAFDLLQEYLYQQQGNDPSMYQGGAGVTLKGVTVN